MRLCTRKLLPAPSDALQPGPLAAFLGLAQRFEPLVRLVANPAGSPTGKRLQGNGRRGVPSDVAWYAYACAQCGCCVDECDQYYGRIWESQSPRGKWFFLREYMAGRARMSQEWVERFLACTTCELCNVKCPLGLPIETAWAQMRGRLVQREKRTTFLPFDVMMAALRKENNIWASYARDRAIRPAHCRPGAPRLAGPGRAIARSHAVCPGDVGGL